MRNITFNACSVSTANRLWSRICGTARSAIYGTVHVYNGQVTYILIPINNELSRKKADENLMNTIKKNIGKNIFMAVGIAVGLWHFYVGTISIFVFKENEPLISWFIIASGPLVTLPATLLGIRFARVSATLLICGASLTEILMTICEGLQGEHVLKYGIYISLPMYILAFWSLILNRQKRVR